MSRLRHLEPLVAAAAEGYRAGVVEAASERQPAVRGLGWRELAVGSVVLVPVAIGAASGGYFSSAWGWIAVIGLWAIAVALMISAPSLSRLESAFLAALLAFVGWVALSALWSESTFALREVERDLAYVVVPLAAFVFLRRASVSLLLGSLTVGIGLLATYSLATRLFPDRIGSYDSVAVYRLSTPIGYWNSLGILSAIGIVLASGFVARSRSAVVRGAAAAGLVFLATALYFTYSRGSWLALGLALVVLVAFDPNRLQALAAVAGAAIVPAVAVWLSARQDALTHQRASVAAAADQGHRLALLLVVLAVLASAVGVIVGAVSARVSAPPALRKTLALVLGVAVIVGAVGVVVAYGNPVSRAWNAFAEPPPKTKVDLNARLFSFSGNGRAELWRASWDDFKSHPLAGTGAGSYEQRWLESRDVSLKVRDAHSLYVEVLGELGLVGLVLLVAAFAVPVAAAFKARRRHPLVPFALAAYGAFLVHAGVDWDWEMPVVVLAGLLCGVALLVWARDREEPLPDRARYGLLGATAVAIVLAFVVLVGNLALAQSAKAARAGDWQDSIRDANRARSWAPWSSEPYQQRGEAQLALGRLAEARMSFRTAISKSPDDWTLWFDLARASAGKAQLAALAHAKRLNRLSPEIQELEHELNTQGSIGVVRK